MKNKKSNLLIFPLLIVAIILVFLIFVILNYIMDKLVMPKDYLFYETSVIPTKLFIFVTMFLVIILLSVILNKFKINKIDKFEVYVDFWKKYKYIYLVIFMFILYAFLNTITIVTKDKIIYKDIFHPKGINYKYNDVSKVETGFGKKRLTLIDYNRRGEFYYRIYFDNKNFTFSVPSVNENIERYRNDTYLELEEFDSKLMEYDIEKVSDNENSKYCILDKVYCNRFVRIVNNKGE